MPEVNRSDRAALGQSVPLPLLAPVSLPPLAVLRLPDVTRRACPHRNGRRPGGARLRHERDVREVPPPRRPGHASLIDKLGAGSFMWGAPWTVALHVDGADRTS